MRYQYQDALPDLASPPPSRPIMTMEEYEAAVKAAQALRKKAQAAAAALHSSVFTRQLWRAVGVKPKLLGTSRDRFLEQHGLTSQPGPAGPYSAYPARVRARVHAIQQQECWQAGQHSTGGATGRRSRHERAADVSYSRFQNGLSAAYVADEGKVRNGGSKTTKKARMCPFCSQKCSKGSVSDRPLLGCAVCQQFMHFECYVRHTGSVPGQQDAVDCPKHAKHAKHNGSGIKVALKLSRAGAVKRSHSTSALPGQHDSLGGVAGKRTPALPERWRAIRDLDSPVVATSQPHTDPSQRQPTGLQRRPERQRSLPSQSMHSALCNPQLSEAHQSSPAAIAGHILSPGSEAKPSPPSQLADSENAGRAVSKSGRPTRAAAPAAGTLKEVQTPLFAPERHVVHWQSSIKDVSKASSGELPADEACSPSTQSHSTHARHSMHSTRAPHPHQALTPALSAKSDRSIDRQPSSQRGGAHRHAGMQDASSDPDWHEAHTKAPDGPSAHRNGLSTQRAEHSSGDLDDSTLALLLHQELNAPAQRQCTRTQRSSSFHIAKSPPMGTALDAVAGKKRKREGHDDGRPSPARLQTAQSL